MGARLGRRAGPQAGSEAGAAAECGPAPYERRVRWLREIQSMLRERQPERARQLLRLLRQAREGEGRPGVGGPGGAGRQGRPQTGARAGRVLRGGYYRLQGWECFLGDRAMERGQPAKVRASEARGAVSVEERAGKCPAPLGFEVSCVC